MEIQVDTLILYTGIYSILHYQHTQTGDTRPIFDAGFAKRVVHPSCNCIYVFILCSGMRIHHRMYRDEKTLQPVWYYNKTPVELKNPKNTYVYVLDPMLATGNSSVETINLFLKKGMKEENLTFVNLLASPQGIERIRHHFKKIRIVTAHIDEAINEKGYIIPGLGDAGDRLFNTFN